MTLEELIETPELERLWSWHDKCYLGSPVTTQETEQAKDDFEFVMKQNRELKAFSISIWLMYVIKYL